MNIVPYMTEQVLTDGVYHLPDGRVFHAQPVRYFRLADASEVGAPASSLDAPKPVSVDALESLIAHLLTQEALDNFGAQYVNGQIDWAEGELQKLLTQKSSSMAACCAPGEGGVSSPSAATSAIVAR